jgi:peptide/nickel transport system substrate-binding protein
VKVRKGMALLAPTVALAMVAAACGGGSGGGGGEKQQTGKGVLVYGESTDWPENLFPLISAGNATSVANILIRVLPGPFRVYPDFTVKPDMDLLTEEPTTQVQGGKQVVTYKLNPKAVWSDGQPIDAKDFKFSWEIQKSSDPAQGGCAALLSTTGYEQIESVVGSDNDKTVTVTYSKPFADWKSLFNQQLFPAHLMDKGDPKANCDEITKGWPMTEGLPSDISGGPWQIKKANIDNGKKVLTLVPNDKYWGAKPKLARLIHQSVGNDPGTMVKALKSGEINMIYPQPQLDLVSQVKDLEPKVTSQTNFGLTFEHLDFNTRNEHLKHKEIRQAFALALDRNAIVQATVGQFDNRAQVLNNRFYVNSQPEYKDNAPADYNTRNVAKAKQLIESIGYKMGSDGYYRAPNGKTLELEICTTVNNPLRETTIDLMVNQLKDAGIKGKKFLNPDIFQDKSKAKSLEAGGFDVALFAWVSSPYVTGNVSIYRSVKGDNQGQNYTHGNDPKVDQLLDQLVVETDTTKQGEIGNAIDTQLWQDLYTLPLYQKPTFIAFDSRYTGIGDNATNSGPLWNSETFTLKQ